MQRVKDYLGRFSFGNQDMSGGLTTAWLDSTLKVSPDEELRFTERLWRGQLAVSNHATEMTRRLTLVETSPSGWVLHGKTGSGHLAPGDPKGKGALYLGWFVGHVSRGEREFVFATSYSDLKPADDDRPPGWIARDMTKTVLRRLGYY